MEGLERKERMKQKTKRERERWERLGIDYRLLWSCQEAEDRWRSTAYFPFVCVFAPPPLSRSSTEWKIGGESEPHKRFTSFLLHLPSLFLPSLGLLRSYFVPCVLRLRMKFRQKETTRGAKKGWKYRRENGWKKENTRVHINGVYFITSVKRRRSSFQFLNQTNAH